MRNNYSPFDKDFDEVAPEDLSALHSVAEGWYVEYKRQVSNASAVAKSITAFANTYGGWIFYGIAEKSKEESVAGAFPGIATDEADGFMQRIRQAAANHSQPTPYFRTRTLLGPVESIGLEGGRCVIMVHVPWGPEAPYVHKDGRIYRRVGDGSEPKPESDRYILDQLWGRSAKITDNYAEWMAQRLETSEAEEKPAFVRLFIIADFWMDHPPLKEVPIDKIREIMSEVVGIYTTPFDNIYRTVGGHVCRQTNNNDPELTGLTWKLERNFQSEIIIPLAKFRHGNLDHIDPWFEEYEHANLFFKLCRQQGYSSPTILDLNALLQVLVGITRIQTALAKEFSWRGPVFAKMEISGVLRAIPFFDAQDILDEYTKHGMPLVLKDKISLNHGTEKDSFEELPGPKKDADDGHHLLLAMMLFLSIANALGVPHGFDFEREDLDAAAWFTKFLGAGERFLKAQETRSRKT